MWENKHVFSKTAFLSTHRVSKKYPQKALNNISAYAKPFWAKFWPVDYIHTCTKSGEFVLTFKNWGIHFFHVYPHFTVSKVA